jgi:uncharacterized protein YecE (DUF72 family)
MAIGGKDHVGDQPPMPELLIGTSGYSYEDWVGPVYPEGTRREDFLGLYAAMFPVVELNFTYYQMPKAQALGRMAEVTPDSFRFALKAHQSLTHEPGEDPVKDIAAFRTGIDPLVRAGKLSAVLLQFPYSFHYVPESRRRLAALLEGLSGLPLAVEFRNAEWQKDSVYEGLRGRGVALAGVDEPDLPRLLKPSTEVTSPLAYIRFHGRNKENWWQGDNVSRYDWLYSEAELREWVPRIRAILHKARVLLAFFNNHRRGMAAQNARDLRRVLKEERLLF